MPTDKNSPEEAASGKPAAKSKRSPAKPPAAKTPAKAAAATCDTAQSSATGNAQPSHADLHEEIRLRAYQIYCERGGQHGMHDADWHRAELEVRAKYVK
jgi:DUF2934 family protein